jgi:branched-chain amino acid transport system substrate-binding protein
MKVIFSRRHVRRVGPMGASLVAIAVLATACGGSSDGGGGSGGDDGDTFTFAFLTPLSGPLAQTGVDMRDGAQVALNEINADGGAGGHKLEMNVLDDKLDPTTGSQLARQAISDGQTAIVGVLSSSVCLAVAPVVDQLGGVFIGTTCSADDLVGEDRKARNFFGVTAHNAQMNAAMATVFADQYPDLKTIDVFGYDYVVGHELYEGFQEEMASHDVDLTEGQAQWVPLNSVDYRNQVAAMAHNLPQDSYADRLLWLSTYGAGTLAFLQQSAPFGLTTKYAAIATSGGYDSGAWGLNGTAPNVWDAYDYYYEASADEANTAFVEAYQKISDGRPPTSWAWEGYMGVKFLAGALEEGGSTEAADIAKALEGVTVDGPTGEATMDPVTHAAQHDVVVFQTVGDKSAPQGLKLLKYFWVDPENEVSVSGP